MAKPVSAVPMQNSVGAAAEANAAAVPEKKKRPATNRKCADGNGYCRALICTVYIVNCNGMGGTVWEVI